MICTWPAWSGRRSCWWAAAACGPVGWPTASLPGAADSIAFPTTARRRRSGRGFLPQRADAGSSRYFLPLSNAEVVGIDLAAGKIVQVSKSRQGNVPGNLICHRGKSSPRGWSPSTAMDNWTWCGRKCGSGWRPMPTTPRRFRCRAKSCWIPTNSGGGRFLPPGVPVGPGPADAGVVPRHAVGRFADRFRRLSRLGRGDRAAVGQSPAAGGLSPLDGRRPAAGGRTGRCPGLLSEAHRPGARTAGRWTRSARRWPCGEIAGSAVNWPRCAPRRKARRPPRSIGPSRRV